MSEERLHQLGTYFVYHDTERRFGITFEKFVELVLESRWAQFLKDRAD